MKPATKIISHVRRSVHKVAYGNPIYQRILASGEAPERLHFTLADIWPGKADLGMAMLTAQRSMFETSAQRKTVAEDLRNLRAVATDKARRLAVTIIEEGMERCNAWNETDWAPAVLGERIAAWIGFYDFYITASPPNFSSRVAKSLHQQWKHLVRSMPAALTGVEALEALRGLILGGLNFPDGDKALGFACDLLRRQMAAEILADGSHVTRNPTVHLHVLRNLLDLRAIFRAGELPLPAEVSLAIASMAPVLKFYRQGDGGLALFHGGTEEESLLIDATLTQSEVKGRMPRRLAEGFFERITAGRSLLIADCGSPPVHGHAGLLAFEFSQGRERIIVNCGSPLRADPSWRAAMAATAAHSTLTVGDTNACDVFTDGVAHARLTCTAQRYEQEGSQGLEMSHDGYEARFRLIHRRLLELSGDGEELSGHDVLEGLSGHDYTVRWHLHPNILVSLAQSGQTALLKTASGSGWRLKIEKGTLSLEPSVYGGEGMPRRCMQLKVSGVTEKNGASVFWRLSREKKT